MRGALLTLTRLNSTEKMELSDFVSRGRLLFSSVLDRVVDMKAPDVVMKFKSVKRSRGIVIATAMVILLLFLFSNVLSPIAGPFSKGHWWTRRTSTSANYNRTCQAKPFNLINSSASRSNQMTFILTSEDTCDPLVGALIADFQERTRIAAASIGREGWDGSLTPEEVEKWEKKHPCRSRRELAPTYSLRKHAKALPQSPIWEQVFEEYSRYHRVCMTAVGNIADYFREMKTFTGCQFMVADTGASIGIGNRLQVVANSVFYGIITRRVILLPTSNHVWKSTCEPIVGSTWLLNRDTFPTPPQNFRNSWIISSEMFNLIDKHEAACEAELNDPTGCAPSTSLPYAAGDITNDKQPSQRFYCPTEQSYYSSVTWVYLSGCIYTIPKTFAISAYRPTLEALFPDRVVLSRLFRSFLLPSDRVWTRVRRLYDTYLQPADRRVGIQMRYLLGHEQYDRIHSLINKRVLDCVSKHRILPEVMENSDSSTAPLTQANSTKVTVLVTSLYPGLHDQMRRRFMEWPTVDGAVVNVVQLTHEMRQEFGTDVDTEAFTEILLLSLMDDLLLMPISTFGGCAQSYGALAPWFVEYREDTQLAGCERSDSVEVCNQYTPRRFDCKYDPEFGTKAFSEVVPGVEDCPQIEFPKKSENDQGIKIRTTFLS